MRILVILVVLGGLILLLANNLSPVSLVFLGISTPALPLAVWILLSVVAGALTTVLITGLQGLSAYLAGGSRPKRSNRVTPPPQANTQRREAPQYTAPPPPPPERKTAANEDLDDWDDDSSSDEWEFEAETDNQANERPPVQPNQIKDSKTYEVSQEPKHSQHSGSVYSYGYKEPRDSGVGKTESVYDAEFRVLTPPYRQIDPPPAASSDDWGFDDDDELFEDEDETDSRPR